MTETPNPIKPAHRRQPWILIGILSAIFILPLIAAWILYFNINRWPLGSTSHGEFIKPARQLVTASLPLPFAGGTLAPDFFKGRWTLVYMSTAFCNPDCEEALYVTRQVRFAMGQQIKEVQRLYLVEGTPQNPGKLLRLHPDLTVVDIANAAGRSFVQQFSRDGHSAPQVGKFIYLVDPRGFYIMRYAINAKPEGLLKDLQHLLGQDGGM
ncbi:MAG: hypothetical protein ACYDB9_03270 [Gammaproteobacteria bacterium]